LDTAFTNISMRETHFVRTGIPIIWRKKQVIVKTIKIIIWEILIYSGLILFGKAVVKQQATINQFTEILDVKQQSINLLKYWTLSNNQSI
jgi:hypothetical protein